METIYTFSEAELPIAMKAQVLALLDMAWPDSRSLEERLPEPLSDPNHQPLVVVLVDAGQVRGYLAIPSTQIVLAGVTYAASGLSAVVVDPWYRQRGCGRRLVQAARELIASSGADIGVFTCDPPLVEFYARCGWSLMPHARVIGGTRERPFPAEQLGKCTMMAFFSEQAQRQRQDFEAATLYLELREGDLW